MYTKEQLQAMSDFEVNKSLHFIRLTQKERKDLESIKFKSSSFEVGFKSGCNYLSHLKDYCNEPNDIVPLAFEHKLSVISAHEDLYAAYADKIEPYVAHKNPLRAIACCLILVLQERDK